MTARDSTSQHPSTPVPDAGMVPTISVVEAGRYLGLGRTTSYELARTDTFPVPVLKAGHRYLVPTAALRRYLHLDVN